MFYIGPVRRLLIIFLMALAPVAGARAAGMEDLGALASKVEGDYRAFYLDGPAMARLGAGVLAAGLLANSSADREADEYYRDDLRSPLTDSISDVARLPGDVLISVPLLFGAYILSGEGEVRSWASDTLRAFAVGAPAGLFLQYATGGSRPEEGGAGWKPFRGNNGLSGHSFTGALPFITAAKRQDSIAVKSVLYGLSVLPGLSRVNDGKHYLSQAALGWYLAYLSAAAIDRGGAAPPVSVAPLPSGVGISVRVLF